jgi:hypothetical protein
VKISHLQEARDHESFKDKADAWLARYTYENLDKWPGRDTILTLLDRYPSKQGKIYRGINFSTQQDYDNFMQQFGGNSQAVLEFSGITSWSHSKSQAQQFAVTQPTYFLNKEVMVAHGVMKKNKERLAGHRGVILETVIKQGDGIDVDASGLGHESEVILPPGSWHVSITQQLKKYQHQLEDGDAHIDQVIQRTTSVEDTKGSGGHHSFFEYVLHHHSDQISNKSRSHIFSLFKPSDSMPAFVYTATPAYVWGKEEENLTDFDYHIPGARLFDLYLAGIFVDPKHQRWIKQLAAKVVSMAVPVLEKHIISARRVNMHALNMVADIAGQQSQLAQVLRNTVGAEYQRLQTQGREINRIRDPRDHERAIKAHTEALSALLNKLV